MRPAATVTQSESMGSQPWAAPSLPTGPGRRDSAWQARTGRVPESESDAGTVTQ
jgi:hypothetical protein